MYQPVISQKNVDINLCPLCISIQYNKFSKEMLKNELASYIFHRQLLMLHLRTFNAFINTLKNDFKQWKRSLYSDGHTLFSGVE